MLQMCNAKVAARDYLKNIPLSSKKQGKFRERSLYPSSKL